MKKKTKLQRKEHLLQMSRNTYKQRSTLRTKIRERSEELRLERERFELEREERRERIETEKKEKAFMLQLLEKVLNQK